MCGNQCHSSQSYNAYCRYTIFRMIYTLYLPFVEGRKLSEDDGVVFLSNGNEDDVVIDLVTAERSENICHYLLRNVADFNM